MPVTFEWRDMDYPLMIIRVENPWNWTEFFLALEESDPYFQVEKRKVGTIFVLPDSINLPPNMLSQTRSIVYKTPANVGASVIVSKSRVVDALIGIFNKLHLGSKVSLRTVKTFEEALQVVAETLTQQE
jgi:hypothetical protein